MPSVLVVQDLKKTYPGTRKAPPVEAVRGLSFAVEAGETFGLLARRRAGERLPPVEGVELAARYLPGASSRSWTTISSIRRSIRAASRKAVCAGLM